MHRKRYTSLASAKLSNIDKSQLVGRRERVLMTDVRLVWLLVASFILVWRPIAAQDTREAAARAALDQYMEAWNAGDNQGIVRASNFPTAEYRSRRAGCVTRELRRD